MMADETQNEAHGAGRGDRRRLPRAHRRERPWPAWRPWPWWPAAVIAAAVAA